MLTLDTILKDTMWVGKFEDGGRIAGTYEELEPNPCHCESNYPGGTDYACV